MEPLHLPKKYIIYDFETTGLDTASCDVIELGAMLVEDGNIVSKKEWLIKVPAPLPEIITQITGITDDLLSQKGEEEAAVFRAFAELARGLPLIGHNILMYDNLILKRKAQIHGLLDAFEEGMASCIDTAALFKAKELGRTKREEETYRDFFSRVLEERVSVKYNLGHACRTHGFDPVSTIMAHRAAADVDMVKFLYDKLAVA